MKSPAFILILILAIALFLRLSDLPNLPTGLHGDEASIGYNAYSLLKTARDQNGNFLPLAIDQFGDFRPAGYHYLAIPFVAFLGLNELAVRLPAALFGAASVIALYLLLFELFQNKNIALAGSFLLAITPWHITISRATSESVIASFFVILGTYFFLKVIKTPTHALLLFSIAFLSYLTSFLFYHAARFFVPVFLIPMIAVSFFLYKPQKKVKLICCLFTFILFFMLFFLFLKGQGTTRPVDISILNIPGGDRIIYQQIGQDGTQNPYITRFFHNKFHFYSRLFLESYSQHFSGEFLFVNNGFPIRYRVPWTGNLHLLYAPFLLFGFAVLLTEGIKRKKLLYLLPIFWIVIGAVPAGLTYEDIPNIQRSSLMIPGIIMLTAFGIKEFFSLISKRLGIVFVVACSVILAQNFLYFYHNYFLHVKINEPWHRSAAVKEIIFTIHDFSKRNANVIMTTQGNNNLIHYLFYEKFDPATFQKLGSPREKDGLKFQNITYTYNPCPLGDTEEKVSGDLNTVYIEKTECKIPQNAQVVKTILHPDGMPAYYAVTINEDSSTSL